MSTGATGSSPTGATGSTGSTGSTGPTPTLFGVSPEAFLGLSLAVVGLISLFIFFTTGSAIVVFIFILLGVLLFLVALRYGLVVLPLPTTPSDIPSPPFGSQSGSVLGEKGSEVFHVADNKFTYEDAPAVCAAYGSQLATLDQIILAYNAGAEWCGYGWSEGGMALYPTQKGTWDLLQKEQDPARRTACGRPGVNGGYFDVKSKFGVNCFGFKPDGDLSFPRPLPGTDPTLFAAAVARFQAMLKTFTLNPYNRNEWSGSTVNQVSSYGKNFTQAVIGEFFTNYGVVEHAIGDIAYENVPGGGSSLGSPLGLIGAAGATGPQGPAGTGGYTGPPGAASTVPGPAGPPGTQGLQGPTGAASNVEGPTGPPGPTGKGEPGAPGATGSPGAAGAPGAPGAPGAVGPAGAQGPPGKDGMGGGGVISAEYILVENPVVKHNFTGVLSMWIYSGRRTIVGGLWAYQQVGDPAPHREKYIVVYAENAAGQETRFVFEDRVNWDFGAVADYIKGTSSRPFDQWILE